MSYIHVARWSWQTANGRSFWAPPVGTDPCTGALDLRSNTDCAVAGGLGGWGVFVYPTEQTGVGWTTLSDDPQGRVGPIVRTLLSNRFGIDTTDLPCAQILQAIFTAGDPDGSLRVKPLTPTEGKWTIHLGFGSPIMADLVDFDAANPQWIAALRIFRRDYAAIRLDDRARALKMLGYWQNRFRVDYRQFLPIGAQDEGTLPPETVYTESFNQADSTTLGPSLSWSEFGSGNFDTVSSEAHLSTLSDGYNYARADSDLSGTDMYVQVGLQRFIGPVAYGGIMIRKDNTSTDTQYSHRTLSGGPDNVLIKHVSGTETKLGTGGTSAHSASTNYATYASIVGSSLTGKIDSVTIDTATDTSITTGTRAGLSVYCGSTSQQYWDAFEYGDISASSGYLLVKN